MSEYPWDVTSPETDSTAIYVPIPSGRPSNQPVWGKMTASDAVNRFSSDLMQGNPIAVNIVGAMSQAGLIKAGANAKQIISAYSSALSLAAKVTAGGNKRFTVFDAIAASAESSAGAGGGGTRSQAQTLRDFVKYTDAQVKSKAIAAYDNILGRKPSAKEIEAFGKALRAGAKAAPQVTKVSASGKTRQTSAGFDENAFIAGYMVTKLPTEGDLDGLAGDVQDLIDSYGENYGVNPTQSFRSKAIRDFVGAEDKASAKNNLEQQLREQAQLLFPALSEKINAGMSVRAIADPYISTVSNLLEKSEFDVDLNDKYVRSALSRKNDKGLYEVASTDDVAREIRKSSEWLNTRNAKETVLSAADSLLQQFGFRR